MNKVMLILFFDAQVAVYQCNAPRHMTINVLVHCKVLRILKRQANKKMPDLKKNLAFEPRQHRAIQRFHRQRIFEKMKNWRSRTHWIQSQPYHMQLLGFWSSKTGIAQQTLPVGCQIGRLYLNNEKSYNVRAALYRSEIEWSFTFFFFLHQIALFRHTKLTFNYFWTTCIS